MNFFKSDKNLPPHKINSELLHWREGDEIIARNIKITGLVSLLTALETDNLNSHYYFKSFTKDGHIIVANKESGNLEKVRLKKFLKHAQNISLKNRALKSDIENSEEYMELMEEFQKAFNELQESDNHPHRLGEPEEQSSQLTKNNSRKTSKN